MNRQMVGYRWVDRDLWTKMVEQTDGWTEMVEQTDVLVRQMAG